MPELRAISWRLGAIFILTCPLLLSCDKPVERTIATQMSDDKRFVAHLYVIDDKAGVLGDDDYVVHVSSFSNPSKPQKVFRGSSAHKVSLTWIDNVLVVEFCNGKSPETNARYDLYSSATPEASSQIFVQPVMAANVTIGRKTFCQT